MPSISKPLPHNCGRPHPQPYCICEECARAKVTVRAHNNAGRKWIGERWKMPNGYNEEQSQ